MRIDYGTVLRNLCYTCDVCTAPANPIWLPSRVHFNQAELSWSFSPSESEGGLGNQ